MIIFIGISLIHYNKKTDKQITDKIIIQSNLYEGIKNSDDINSFKKDTIDLINEENDRKNICIKIDNLATKYKDLILSHELKEYIVLEKYRNDTIIFDEESDKSNLENIDSMYYVIFEECYIVWLIEESSDIQTSTKNWRVNLNYLQNNYDTLIENINTNLFKFYIDNYIEVYSHNEE